MKDLLGATWRLFALVMVGVLPFIVLASIVGWHDLIKIAVYAFFVAFLATVPNGTRLGITFTAMFAGFSVVGVAVGETPWGAACVVGLSVVVLLACAWRGFVKAGIFFAMFVPNVFNPPPVPWFGETQSVAFFCAVAGVTLLGGLWGTLIGRSVRNGLPRFPPLPTVPVRPVVAGGSVLVLVVFVLTFYSVANFPQAKWAWLLAAIYSMMMAAEGLSWKASIETILGTLAGVGIALVVLLVALPISLVVLVGTVLMSASIALRMANKRYWISTAVSTAGVIFVTGAGMDPFLAAEDRLIFTMVGAVIAVLLGLMMVGVVRLFEVSNQDQKPNVDTVPNHH